MVFVHGESSVSAYFNGPNRCGSGPQPVTQCVTRRCCTGRCRRDVRILGVGSTGQPVHMSWPGNLLTSASVRHEALLRLGALEDAWCLTMIYSTNSALGERSLGNAQRKKRGNTILEPGTRLLYGHRRSLRLPQQKSQNPVFNPTRKTIK